MPLFLTKLILNTSFFNPYKKTRDAIEAFFGVLVAYC
jgi:hypothetical protein